MSTEPISDHALLQDGKFFVGTADWQNSDGPAMFRQSAKPANWLGVVTSGNITTNLRDFARNRQPDLV